MHAQRGAGGRGGGDLATRDPYENPTYDHIGNDKFVSSAGGEGGAGRTVENPMYGAQRSPNGEQAFVEQADDLSVASPKGVIRLTEGEVSCLVRLTTPLPPPPPNGRRWWWWRCVRLGVV